MRNAEDEKLKVQLEFDNAKAIFEGNVNEVYGALTKFLTNFFPNLELVQRITFTPDIVGLIDELAGIIELTPEGPIFTSDFQLSAREKICIALLGAYVGQKLGILNKSSLSTSELSRITKKARKTISNEIPKLIAGGIVERTLEGECQITTLGIRETENLVREEKNAGNLPKQ